MKVLFVQTSREEFVFDIWLNPCVITDNISFRAMPFKFSFGIRVGLNNNI